MSKADSIFDHGAFTIEFPSTKDGSPYLCERCGCWYLSSNVSCNVDHLGACCHIYESTMPMLAVPQEEPTEKGIIHYKFRENDLLVELRKYIDATYGQHYAQSQIQSSEVIIDQGHGVGFMVGNILKYAQRYGKKDGHNRKDIMKVLHYAIILLHVHDLEHIDEA